MDPNTALEELRLALLALEDLSPDLAPELSTLSSLTPSSTIGAEAARAIDSVVEKFDALDQWLSNGGFLPDEWNKNREKA